MGENTRWQISITRFQCFFFLRKLNLEKANIFGFSSPLFSFTKTQPFRWGQKSLIKSNTGNILVLITPHGTIQGSLWDWQGKWVLNKKMKFVLLSSQLPLQPPRPSLTQALLQAFILAVLSSRDTFPPYTHLAT